MAGPQDLRDYAAEERGRGRATEKEEYEMSRWAGWKVLVEIYEGNFSMPGDADEWAEYLRKHLP